MGYGSMIDGFKLMEYRHIFTEAEFKKIQQAKYDGWRRETNSELIMYSATEENKYEEYIVIKVDHDDGSHTNILERVGDWKVDLSGYLTTEVAGVTYLSKTEASTIYATQTDVSDNYLKKTDAAITYETVEHAENTYETKTNVEATYLKKADAETTYSTKDEVSNLNNTLTAKIDGKVDALDGFGLISNENITKLNGIETGAQVNKINSVDENKFTITDGKLLLNELTVSSITNLENILNEKVNKVYYAVTDEETGETSQVEGTLLSPGDKAKLDALTLNNGDISISGSVEAS
jgi:hypothetical protein